MRKAILSEYLSTLKTIEIIPLENNDESVSALIEGVLIGGYVWTKHKSLPKDFIPVLQKQITLVAGEKQIFRDAVTICEGVNTARDLVNDNADTITSEYIEKTVKALVKGKKHITLEILGEKEMKAKGLGLHLAVNRASKRPPKLIIVKYNGASKTSGYTALVGKGMTYDTGGLNLKPTGSMETMKMDMSGSAAVVGALKNTIALNLKKNALFVMSMAENCIDSVAYKPGDVIKGYAGKTVEIGNTDAEGRLILADAMAYVIKNYKPSHLIDIATLTGACVIALAHDHTGLVTTDDKFARKIVRASNATDDRVWRMPIYPELKDAVKSRIADIRNTGYPRGAGGTITAAEFLRQFAEGATWAHLDIAGTAYNESTERWYYSYGATGAGVRLLTHLIQHNT